MNRHGTLRSRRMPDSCRRTPCVGLCAPFCFFTFYVTPFQQLIALNIIWKLMSVFSSRVARRHERHHYSIEREWKIPQMVPGFAQCSLQKQRFVWLVFDSFPFSVSLFEMFNNHFQILSIIIHHKLLKQI